MHFSPIFNWNMSVNDLKNSLISTQCNHCQVQSQTDEFIKVQGMLSCYCSVYLCKKKCVGYLQTTAMTSAWCNSTKFSISISKQRSFQTFLKFTACKFIELTILEHPSKDKIMILSLCDRMTAKYPHNISQFH